MDLDRDFRFVLTRIGGIPRRCLCVFEQGPEVAWLLLTPVIR